MVTQLTRQNNEVLIKSSTDLPTPDVAKNMILIGHTDQGGRPDGIQLMVNKRFMSTEHMFSKDSSVIDVRNRGNQPTPMKYVPAQRKNRNIHLQTHEDLLLVINAKDIFAAGEFQDEKGYYRNALGKKVDHADAELERDWTAGLSVYDIADPAEPRQIGSCQSKVAASTTSVTSVGSGPTRRSCSTASPTNSS